MPKKTKSTDWALRLAIKAMKQQRQKFAVDAHLYSDYGVRNPTAVNARDQYDDYNAAIRILEELFSLPGLGEKNG